MSRDNAIERYYKSYSADPVVQKQAGIMLKGILYTSIFSFCYVGVCILIGFREGVWIQLAQGMIFLLLPLLFLPKTDLRTIGVLFNVVSTITILLDVYYTGGMRSPVLPWLATTAIFSLLFVSRLVAFILATINAVLVAAICVATFRGYVFPVNYDTSWEVFFTCCCLTGLIYIYLILNLVFERGLSIANQKLELQSAELSRQRDVITAEKEKSDSLLHNILPAEVADELKHTGTSAAHLYNEVTVLFTDFVGFTTISETMSPQELVAELHECFTVFDAIIERNGLEKIKTIGDAYMAVCGLPVSDEQHASKTVQAAVDILDFVRQRRQAHKGFDIRIGVNSGPVVAGIVGVKKFAYDIWGDTVNTAARMEQNSAPGRINISETTYALVKGQFSCTARGRISAKNKGDIEMYFAEAGEA